MSESNDKRSCKTCGYFQFTFSKNAIGQDAPHNFGRCDCPVPASVNGNENVKPLKVLMLETFGENCDAWKNR